MSAPTSPTVSGKLIAKLTESLCKGNGSRSEPDDSTLERAAEAAAEIEAELAKTFGSTKEYAAKGRSLCFNLGKNSSLRVSVLGGYFPAAALVNASTKELATRHGVRCYTSVEDALNAVCELHAMAGWGTSQTPVRSAMKAAVKPANPRAQSMPGRASRDRVRPADSGAMQA